MSLSIACSLNMGTYVTICFTLSQMVIEGVISNGRHKARPYFKKEGAILWFEQVNFWDAKKLSQFSTPADILARVCFNIPLKCSIKLLA